MTGRFADCECGHRHEQHAEGGGCSKCECDGFSRVKHSHALPDLRPPNKRTQKRSRVYGDRL